MDERQINDYLPNQIETMDDLDQAEARGVSQNPKTGTHFTSLIDEKIPRGRSKEPQGPKDPRDKYRETIGVSTATADAPPAVAEFIETAFARANRLDQMMAGVGGEGRTLEEGELITHKSPQVQNRLFKPRGNIAKLFYDKRPIVGLGGPAGTGKSRGILEKLHLIAEKYAHARILIARKVREGLTEAALFTYEEHVLPEGHAALEGPRRSHRQSYLYPNGSVVNIAGLDKPQKIMSTEYDIIYVQEATECDEADFDFLNTRLRNGIVPYQQLLFDCNPDAPTHWIYQNNLMGRLVMYDTEHEDNPRWFDVAPVNQTSPTYEFPHTSALSGLIGRFTELGKGYIEKLDALSGARYLRLRLGKWAAAEGQIYDTFTPADHLEDHYNPPNGVGYWIWCVDFGWSKPFVLQMWWIDEDGGAHMWREIYMTQRLVEDHAKSAIEAAGWAYDDERGFYPHPDYEYQADLPDAVVCDHDAEGRATLEVHLHLRIIGATKAILEGIDAVKARLKLVGPKKRARTHFMRGSLWEEDADLKDKKQPVSTIQEVDSYIWKLKKPGQSAKEQPIDEYNHGMDAWRYLVCYLDGITGGRDIKAKEVASEIMASPPVAVIKPAADRMNDMFSKDQHRRSRTEKVAAKRKTRSWY